MMTKIKYIVFLLLFISANSLFAQEDLSLAQAIETGLKRNFNIEIAAQRSEIAKLNTGWGAAGGYPTISFNAGTTLSDELLYNSGTSSIGVLNSTAGLNINWLVFGGLKVKTTRFISNLQYDLSKGSEMLEVENNIKSIILAYYAIVLEKELLKVYQDVLKLSEDRYNREKMSHELGGTDTYNLIQAENAYLADKRGAIQQELSIRSSVYQLNNLINVPIETEWNIAGSLNIPNFDYSLGAMSDKMFANNTNLKNQYINQRVSQEQIKLAKSNIYPQISAFANMGYSNTLLTSGGTNSINSLTPSVGAKLTLNIYNGGITNRNIKVSEINSRISETTTAQMKQYLTSQLMQYFDQYAYYKQLVDISTREVNVAKTSLDISYEKYNNGSISSFDFRQVQVIYSQAVYNKLTLMFNLIQSNTELTQLVGGILSTSNGQ